MKSQILTRSLTLNRRRLVVGVVSLIWIILAARLVHIQVLDRAQFREQAQRQQTQTERIPARPGDLLDRDGRLLATTVRVSSLYVDPSMIDDPERFVEDVARVLAMDPAELLERITQDPQRRFLWIRRRLRPAEEQAVRDLGLPLGTWGFRQEFLRRYPQGSLAAHVIGLRDVDGIGHGGAEEAFDALLRGRDGRRELVRDARGYVIEVLEEVAQPPRHGEPVMLTIDSVLQFAVERELDDVMEEWSPRGACAIVLDPQTGELLAMASRPVFDPNDAGQAEPGAWSNRALTAVFEPGSTLKPCIVAWAVDQGFVDREEEFDCAMGAYRMGRRILHDHHPYGTLSVGDILVQSSNIGMARIGERLSNHRLRESLTAFGFGRPTGIELPGELPGILRPLEEWTAYSTGSIPMGQELAVTPLQVITAHAMLANGGRTIVPHVFLRTPGRPVQLTLGAGPRRLSEATACWIVQGPLTDVVERGTGTKAALEGVAVFGKSGTAQTIDPDTGGYSPDRSVCSFVCGAPAEDPALLVLVCVDEPTAPGNHSGGTVAAPAAAAILDQALSRLRSSSRVAASDNLTDLRHP